MPTVEAAPQVPGAAVFASWVRDLALCDGNVVDDAARVDQLQTLEMLKAAAAAAQARVTAAFEASQRAAQEAAGVSSRKVGAGIGAQVALARRESPQRGGRLVGLARALVTEMPHLHAAMSAGLVTEWRATLAVRETGCLSSEDRGVVDAELAATPGGIGAMGDAAIVAAARRIAYRLDPHGFTARAARAAGERRVTIRPALDTMALVTGLLPVREGVAVYAALTRHADTVRAGGDDRSRAQIMADTFVERLTGQATATGVPVEVQLVIPAGSLLDLQDQSGDQDHDPQVPAWVHGYGPVPAPLAREWLRDTDAQVWLRRLFTRPGRGQLVAMDSRRRVFTGRLRRLVVLRDQVCRTPWCDAPVRHVDHPRPFAVGGATTAKNSQGLCEACNYAKEAVGWRARPVGDGVIETRTPTGHRYDSPPPPLTGASPPPRGRPPTRLELSFHTYVLSA
jgi:hypothetical protein